jgi:hypothetical protein
MSSFKHVLPAMVSVAALGTGSTPAQADGGRAAYDRQVITSLKSHPDANGDKPNLDESLEVAALQLSSLFHLINEASASQFFVTPNGPTAEEYIARLISIYAGFGMSGLLQDADNRLLVSPDPAAWVPLNGYSASGDGSFSYDQQNPENTRPAAVWFSKDKALLVRASGKIELFAANDPNLAIAAPWINTGTAVDVRQAMEKHSAVAAFPAKYNSEEWKIRAEQATSLANWAPHAAAGAIGLGLGGLALGSWRWRQKSQGEQQPEAVASR